jgi:uncharacterized protein YkwD
MRLTGPQLGSLLLLVAVVAGGAAVGYAPDGTAADTGETPTPMADPDPVEPEWSDERLAELERELATDLNEWRSARGLSTLNRSEPLDEVARGHAKFIATEQTGSHTGEGSTDPSERVGECFSGEVITHGHREGSATSSEVASSFIQNFAQSEPHREILLDSHERIGVGVEVGDDGRLYVVIDFC